MNALNALMQDIDSGDAVLLGHGVLIEGNWNVSFKYKGVLFACRFKNYEIERCDTQPCDNFKSLQPFVNEYNHHMVIIQNGFTEDKLIDYIAITYIEPKDIRGWMKRSVDSDPSFWWVGGRATKDSILTNSLTSNLLVCDGTKYYSRKIHESPVLLTGCPLKGNVYIADVQSIEPTVFSTKLYS